MQDRKLCGNSDKEKTNSDWLGRQKDERSVHISTYMTVTSESYCPGVLLHTSTWKYSCHFKGY